MITEMLLALAALLLGAFCLVHSVRKRRELFFPLPKGLPALLKSRAVWLAVIVVLMLTAAVSLAEMLAAPGAAAILHTAYLILQGALLLAFLLHTLNHWRHPRKSDRRTALALCAVVMIGAAVEAGLNVRVALFFEAVTLFAWMLLFEREEDSYGKEEGRHILIAEDQKMNAEILTDLLEMEDISSEWAENGELAVEVFAGSEEGHFDAILMDMRMPVLDGLGATREIRKLDRADASTVPIIALTANAFEEDVRQCLEAGMNAHLSKPVDIELLKQTLGRLLAERK